MWIPLDLQATFSDYLCAEFQHWGLSQGGRWQCTSPGSQERRERRATTSTGTPSGPDPVCVPQGLARPREGGGSDLAQLTKGSAGNRANQPRPTIPVRLGDPDGGGSAGAESAKVHPCPPVSTERRSVGPLLGADNPAGRNQIDHRSVRRCQQASSGPALFRSSGTPEVREGAHDGVGDLFPVYGRPRSMTRVDRQIADWEEPLPDRD